MPRVISDELYKKMVEHLAEQPWRVANPLIQELGPSKDVEAYVRTTGREIVKRQPKPPPSPEGSNGQEGVSVRSLTDEEAQKLTEDPSAELGS